MSAASAGKKQQITIRMKRGLQQCIPKHRATIKALGLKRIRHERTLENTPAVRGMIKQVMYLVEVVSET